MAESSAEPPIEPPMPPATPPAKPIAATSHPAGLDAKAATPSAAPTPPRTPPAAPPPEEARLFLCSIAVIYPLDRLVISQIRLTTRVAPPAATPAPASALLDVSTPNYLAMAASV